MKHRLPYPGNRARRITPRGKGGDVGGNEPFRPPSSVLRIFTASVERIYRIQSQRV